MSPGLVAFLKARLDEGEITARRILDGADPQVWPWEVWVTPGVRECGNWEVEPSIGIAEYAPKAYRRVWQQGYGSKFPHFDYGWHIHDSAICVWSEGLAKQALREVEAKRARLALLDEAVTEMDRLLANDDAAKIDQGVAIGRKEAALTAVRHDAAVYSDHPDYRDDWKP